MKFIEMFSLSFTTRRRESCYHDIERQPFDVNREPRNGRRYARPTSTCEHRAPPTRCSRVVVDTDVRSRRIPARFSATTLLTPLKPGVYSSTASTGGRSLSSWV